MARPYGKRPKKPASKSEQDKSNSHGLKIKLRGKDGAPLSMAELQQGFYETARKLAAYKDIRAKWVTIYLTAVDENGEEVTLDPKGEWIVHPYRSAADERGV